MKLNPSVELIGQGQVPEAFDLGVNRVRFRSNHRLQDESGADTENSMVDLFLRSNLVNCPNNKPSKLTTEHPPEKSLNYSVQPPER